MSEPVAGADRRPRVALLFGNTIEHNSRAMRMATTLTAAGAEVLLVGRAAPGLPLRETRPDHEIVRVPAPRGPRWLPGPRLPDATRPRAAASSRGPDYRAPCAAAPSVTAGVAVRGVAVRRAAALLREGPGRAAQALRYLIVAREWAAAVERAVPRADAWQADGLVMLPVALRLRDLHGGRVVYDSLEIHVESGRFARLPGPWRRLLALRERRWAQAADAVITVSRAYADVLTGRLGRMPAIVMNCPPAPAVVGEIPRPRLFHRLLGLPDATPIVLYHGYLFRHRGIERLMRAMALVPDAHLVVMGIGESFDAYVAEAAALPWGDRLHVVPGVAPAELLEWVGSADVAAMPIEGTTLNHRLTTPNKLFEAMSAGVPVVASDLPGMAAIVRETGAGVLCDPDDERDVARAIRSILEAPPDERAAYRERALAAAARTYNWERQAQTYLGVYRAIGAIGAGSSTATGAEQLPPVGSAGPRD